MTGCLRSCVGKAVGLVLLAALAAATWFWGPEYLPGVFARFGGSSGEVEVQPSPELAESTLERVESLRGGDGEGRLTLGAAEVSSVIRYALPGIIPPGVSRPTIELRDGKVDLSARVAVAAFPEMPSLREVVGVLPDTVDIAMRGSVVPYDDGNAALYVERLQAMRIPLPDRFIPRVLEALGRKDREGLPRQAMLIPLPRGLGSVYVQDDSLVLVADR